MGTSAKPKPSIRNETSTSPGKRQRETKSLFFFAILVICLNILYAANIVLNSNFDTRNEILVLDDDAIDHPELEYPKLEHSEFALVEPASYANRVELTNKEYFINNSTVFHIAQYNPALFFAQIYPELKEKILDPRAIIPHKEELFARAANSTEHDVLLSGGWGAIRPGMRPKTISGEWLEKNWKGKIIFLNGEYFVQSGWSNSSVLPFKNQYHIGFVKDGCQSVRLHFLTQKYGASPHLWDSFRPEAAKPTSKQERFVIYINRNCVDFREEAFDSIAMEFPNKTLEYGSKCLGNKKNLTNVVRTDIRLQKWEGMWNDMNKDTFNHFRFCLVMENHDLEGYITEKIMNAFMGGCIPIYYGTKEIFDIFNAKSFIFYDIDNPQSALNEIRRLEYNATAYEEVMKEPILRDGNNTIQKYFSVSDNLIPNASLKNKIREMTQYACKRE